MNSVISNNPVVFNNKKLFETVSKLYSDDERAAIRERIKATGLDIEDCKNEIEKGMLKAMVGDFVYEAPESVAHGGLFCSVENIMSDLAAKRSSLRSHAYRKGAKEPFPSALRENPVSPWKVEMATEQKRPPWATDSGAPLRTSCLTWLPRGRH